MNSLLIGFADKTERLLELTNGPFLLIDDGEIADVFLDAFPKARLFDVAQHSFNPLRGMDYKRARDFTATLYTASPQGENTLRVRDGKRALPRLLLANPERLDRIRYGSSPADEEAKGMIDDLLLSPVLRQVLCDPPNFSLKGSVVAKLDRAELGDFDAFVLASLLVGQTKRQVIIPDFGFYGRDFHTSLIRQNWLVVGLQSFSEVSEPLQQALLGMKAKTIYRTTREDAERLISYTKHTEPSIIVQQTGDEYILT